MFALYPIDFHTRVRMPPTHRKEFIIFEHPYVRKFTLCMRFQFGNSFVNTKVPRKFTLCIRFQLGNSFANTKVEKKNHQRKTNEKPMKTNEQKQ